MPMRTGSSPTLSKMASAANKAASGSPRKAIARAVARVDHHAIARLQIGERMREHLIEVLLEADLVAHAMLRVAGDIEEKHAAHQRAARLLGTVALHQRMPGSMPFMLRIMR